LGGKRAYSDRVGKAGLRAKAVVERARLRRVSVAGLSSRRSLAAPACEYGEVLHNFLDGQTRRIGVGRSGGYRRAA
jgi:hypothetical protein